MAKGVAPPHRNTHTPGSCFEKFIIYNDFDVALIVTPLYQTILRQDTQPFGQKRAYSQ